MPGFRSWPKYWIILSGFQMALSAILFLPFENHSNSLDFRTIPLCSIQYCDLTSGLIVRFSGQGWHNLDKYPLHFGHKKLQLGYSLWWPLVGLTYDLTIIHIRNSLMSLSKTGRRDNFFIAVGSL